MGSQGHPATAGLSVVRATSLAKCLWWRHPQGHTKPRLCCPPAPHLSWTSVAAGRGNLAHLQGGLVWPPCLLCLNQTWDTVSNVAGEAMVGPNQEGTGSPAHLQEGVIPWNAAATQRVRETTLIVEQEKPLSQWGLPVASETSLPTVALTSSIKGWLSAKGLKGMNTKSAGPFFSSLFSRRLLPPCGHSHRTSVSRFSKAHL